MANKIPGKEIAELFRKVIRGETKVVCVGTGWDAKYSGNVVTKIDGYTVVIFNDCSEFDYVDHAIAPDGRRGDFDDWWDAHENPVDLLSPTEQGKMERALEEAPVEDA